jgi:lipopolysaccharide transport system ATP-binding protein
VSKKVIEVNNISKEYRLGTIGISSFVDDVKDLGRKFGLPFKAPDQKKKFFALDRISFSSVEGEVLGIIGHNGAGKSTLLKILSRITEPTSGSALLRGRIASLLEIGTGFHGELTGKDNIFLNGSLNGLSSSEIQAKLDAIIEFAQIGKHINTPVKRYSSGMYVRLAFAVAAHLDPDILIIDEVLAVGDLAFQKKCISKMHSVASKGKTVIIVSHQMSVISQLCDRCILIENGKVKFSGSPYHTISKYFGLSSKKTSYQIQEDEKHGPQNFSTIINVIINNSLSKSANVINFGSKLEIKLSFETFTDVKNFEIGISFRRLDGQTVATSLNQWEGFQDQFSVGKHNVYVNIENIFIIPGEYFITAWTKMDNDFVDCQVQNAEEFSILNCSIGEKPMDFTRYENAGVAIRSNWELA